MAIGVPQKITRPAKESSGPIGGALLGSPDPALLGDVEDDAVGVLVLDLEVRVFLVLAEREEELAAGRLDALLRRLEVIDLEAEVVRADEIGGVLEARARLALVLEEREVDDAVAEIDRRAHVDVLFAHALELEHLLVEARRALEIAHHDRYVPQLRHVPV